MEVNLKQVLMIWVRVGFIASCYSQQTATKTTVLMSNSVIMLVVDMTDMFMENVGIIDAHALASHLLDASIKTCNLLQHNGSY